jgi:outer membrane receptor for ferrienterochelin and colicins
MINYLKFAIATGLLFLMLSVSGQNAELKILDYTSGEPVAFAHLKVTPLGSSQSKYFVSDVNGLTGLTVTAPVEVKITFVGYQSFNDTLLPGCEPVIKLRPSVTTFDEMVVTAQYSPVSADRSLYKINVINSMQIKKKAAYNLAGLMRNQLNVRLSQDGAVGTGISIQGLSGENVKILVDGVPVIGRLNGVIDLSQVNLQNVQQVEMIEGPMSVIYGSNALAGVINIIPKENDTKRISANASAYTESVGVYNFDGGFGLKKGIHGFSFQAGRNFFDGFDGNNTGRQPEWKPRRQVNLDADYNLYLKKFNIKTRLSLFDELLKSNGDLLPLYFEKAFDNDFNTDRYTATVNFATKGCNHFTASNSYSYYSRIRTLYYNDLTVLEKTKVSSDTTRFGSWMSRGMYTYRGATGILGFQAGYDLNAEWADGDRVGGKTQSITDLAGFFSLQYHPIDYLSFQPGLRLAYNSRFDSPLIYALHVKTGPFHGSSFRTSYSSGFRAPSIKELYMSFVDVNHKIYGNTELTPEKSQHLQFQYLHKIEKTKYAAEAEVNLFLNNVSNIITLASMQDGSYTYVNVDHYRTRGYSAQIRATLFPAFDARLGYGHTGTQSTFSDAETRLKFSWSPEITTEVTYMLDKKNMSFSAYYKYTGKVPRFNVSDAGEVTEGKVDAYNNLDISVYKSFMDDRITLTIGAKNLFDVTSINSSTPSGNSGSVHSGGDFPIAWGRTFFAKINFSIWRDEKK